MSDVAARADLYQRDFYAWALGQADNLRQLAESRPNLPLDFPNLIDEVEDLARSLRRGVLRQLERLMQHLLKLEHGSRPEPRRQWWLSVDDARGEIEADLTPTISASLAGELERIYGRARRAAAVSLIDHGEPEAARALPVHLPYGLDQMLDRDWLPRNRHGIADDLV